MFFVNRFLKYSVVCEKGNVSKIDGESKGRMTEDELIRGDWIIEAVYYDSTYKIKKFQ